MAALEKVGAIVLLGLGAIYTPGVINFDVNELLGSDDNVVIAMVTETKDNLDSFTERAQGLEGQQRDLDNSLDNLSNR